MEPVESDEMMDVRLELTKADHAEAKVLAIRRGKTLRAFVADLIRREIAAAAGEAPDAPARAQKADT